MRLLQFVPLLGEMPFWAVVAAVVLGGFALAAYAIYAVLTVTKSKN